MFVGPVLLQAIIEYVKTPEAPTYTGFGFVIAMFAASGLQTLLLHQYFFIAYNTGMKVRDGFQSARFSHLPRNEISSDVKTVRSE